MNPAQSWEPNGCAGAVKQEKLAYGSRENQTPGLVEGTLLQSSAPHLPECGFQPVSPSLSTGIFIDNAFKFPTNLDVSQLPTTEPKRKRSVSEFAGASNAAGVPPISGEVNCHRPQLGVFSQLLIFIEIIS